MYVNTPTVWSVLEYPRQVKFKIENFGVIINFELVFNIFISIVHNYYVLVIILILINYFICTDIINYSIDLNIDYHIASKTIIINPELLRTHIINKQILRTFAMV